MKCYKQAKMFMDYSDGGWGQTYELSHEIGGERVVFGAAAYDKRDRNSPETMRFCLIDDPKVYESPADFDAAYYEKYPEMRQKNGIQ